MITVKLTEDQIGLIIHALQVTRAEDRLFYSQLIDRCETEEQKSSIRYDLSETEFRYRELDQMLNG